MLPDNERVVAVFQSVGHKWRRDTASKRIVSPHYTDVQIMMSVHGMDMTDHKSWVDYQVMEKAAMAAFERAS